jgi:hypothetical protein
MRQYVPSVCIAIALAVGLVYSTSQALAQACAVGMNIHHGAWIVLHHQPLTRCVSGAAGCKCVSCYNFNGSVSAVCYPLAAPIPH